MSDFDDAMSEGLAESLDYLGTTPFKIAGKDFAGIYTEFSGAKELGSDGPVVGTYPATILAALPQFVGKFPAPLEHSLAEKRLTILGRTFRVAIAVVDASSVTLHLENVNAVK